MIFDFPGTPVKKVTSIRYDLGGGTFDDPPSFVLDFDKAYNLPITLAEWQGMFEDYVEAMRTFFDTAMSGPAVTVHRQFLGYSYQDDGNVTL